MEEGIARDAFLVQLAAALQIDARKAERALTPDGLVVVRGIDLAKARKLAMGLVAHHCKVQIVEASTGQSMSFGAQPSVPSEPIPPSQGVLGDPVAADRYGAVSKPHPTVHRGLWVAFIIATALLITATRIHFASRRGPVPTTVSMAGASERPVGAGTVAVFNSPDIQVLRSAGFTPSDSAQRILAAIPQSSGGFLAVAGTPGGSASLYDLSSSGSVIWRKELPVPTHSTVSALGVWGEGGYWIGGFASDVPHLPESAYAVRDFTLHISDDGVSSLANLSDATESRYFHCATGHNGRFVQVGFAAVADDPLHLQVPSVTTMDGSGRRLWEYLTPIDGTHRLENGNQTITDCVGIVTLTNDRLIAATRVLVFPAQLSNEGVLAEMKLGIHLRPGTFLVALSSDGKPLHTLRHDDATGGLLLAGPNNTLYLFESPFWRPGTPVLGGGSNQNPFAASSRPDQRLRLYTLNSDLQEISGPIIFENSAFDRAEAAYVTPEGGILFKGCPGSDKDQHGYLQYLTPAGQVSAKRHIDEFGWFCGGVYAFGPGAARGQVLVLAQPPQTGSRLIAVKYAN